jgi:hypothetical protein
MGEGFLFLGLNGFSEEKFLKGLVMLNRKGFLEAKIGLIEKEFLCRPQGVQRRLQHLQTDFNGAV